MVEGVLDIYRGSPVIFADTKREEGHIERDGTMRVKIHYLAASGLSSLSGRFVVAPDIMLATGSSLCILMHQLTKTYGSPRAVDIYSVIATKPGIERVLEKIPNTRVFTAAIDPELNPVGYIVPGLGDAGDKCFNGKESVY